MMKTNTKMTLLLIPITTFLITSFCGIYNNSTYKEEKMAVQSQATKYAELNSQNTLAEVPVAGITLSLDDYYECNNTNESGLLSTFVLTSVDINTNRNNAFNVEEELILEKSDEVKDAIKVYTFGNSLTEISKEDFETLSHLVAAEAENQTLKAQKAVAQVVINRMLSGKYPNTISGVIFDPGQFSCIDNGRYDRSKSNEKTDKAVLSVLRDRKVLPTSVIYFSSGKLYNGTYYAQIDDMYFGTEYQ